MQPVRAFLRFVPCLAAFVLVAPLAAQGTGSVAGVAIDSASGLTLSGATIRAAALDRSTVTDAEGRFALVNLPAGRVELVATYLGYGPATQSVTIGDGEVVRVRFSLGALAQRLQGVVVTGQRVGQAAALNKQMTAPNITNQVASDQIGRFPDANIGDAMKRIPGIVVTQDQGEARFGIIRGTEPRLNAITLNGERIPSAEAEIRNVQLDLIPSDMVSAIEVNKVLTPEMDADAIGASVNIVTRSAPETQRLSATVGSGYNFLSEKPMGVGSLLYSQRFVDDRLGIVLNGSVLDHKLGSDNIEGTWAGTDAQPYVNLWEMRRYDIQRTRQSMGASLDYRLSDASTLYYRGMANHRNDWENRYRQRWIMGAPNASGVQTVEVRKQLKFGPEDNKWARLEDQRTQSHAVTGNHLLGNTSLDWTVQYARASEERPNERYLQFRRRNLTGTTDLSDPERPFVTLTDLTADSPANLGFHELTSQNQWTEDKDLNARLDLAFLVPGGGELKVGGRYRDKSKLRENNFFEYEPLSGIDNMGDITLSDVTRDFLAGSKYRSGLYPTREVAGALDLTNTSRFDEADLPEEYKPGNFDATERIAAGYISLTRQLNQRAALLAGVRIESTNLDYNGFEYDIDNETSSPTSGSATYTNFFPSLSLRFDLGDRRVLRTAWTNTIARPNYYDLVPYRSISRDDDELAIGNPDLKPTKSMNFDVMYEQYMSSVGLFSMGVFYKDITDFIYGYTKTNATDPVTGDTFAALTQPLNGASASLFGFEVALQRPLFGNFSMYANYTYTHSKVDGFPIAGRTNEDLPLPGTSENTVNASLAYDADRFTFRASLNFQDDFLDPEEGVGASKFFDRWYDRSTTVDLNGEVILTQTARFFFEANNLTNQPLRYYQGIRSRTMQAEYYSRRIQAGLKLNLR